MAALSLNKARRSSGIRMLTGVVFLPFDIVLYDTIVEARVRISTFKKLALSGPLEGPNEHAIK